jgi:hypothetical protein
MSEAIFLLVLLKIPVVYLCLVVWWAIRAEPQPPEPEVLVRVPDTPIDTPPTAWVPRGPRAARPSLPPRRPVNRRQSVVRAGGRR